VLVERRAPEPIIPLRFFRNRTVVLSSLASLFVGVAMFGATVFLSQYFQLARGESPLMAGVMTIPMIAGLAVSSTVVGQVITRTGRWKIWVIIGGVLLTAGLGLMATVGYDTNYWLVAPYMLMIGAGVGMMMQNLVLSVQNVIAVQDLGAASSFVAFTRSLGGAIGVSALGALLGHRVSDHLASGLAAAGIRPPAGLGAGGGIPDLSAIPEPVRTIVQSAYGSGVADIFFVAAPFALLALVICFFLTEVKLKTSLPGRPEQVDPQIEDDQRWNTPADQVEHPDAHGQHPVRAGAGRSGDASA
jgi:MFS family permease